MEPNMENMLSESAQAVYAHLAEKLKAVPGPAAEAAQMDAFLFALHADTFASKIAKLHHAPYTAMDYMQDSFQLNLNTSREDAEYMAAIEAGDMETVRRMVEAKAAANGFNDAIPEQTKAYVVRNHAAPKKTIKAYKVFTMAPDGAPTALFVAGAEKLPQGVWLDAVDSWHFTGSNGLEYVPCTPSPYTDGDNKGGQDRAIPSEEVRQELIRRGYLDAKSKAKNITTVAYRPGWHAGSLPFFPQGGKKDPRPDAPHPHKHLSNQVVFEIEMAAEQNYTEKAGLQLKARKKNGELWAAKADLQYIPKDGFYYYATNQYCRNHPESTGAWAISGSIKIGRALSQEECDRILAEAGIAPQEWVGGQMDLTALGYEGEQKDAARKTLAPITYDENGEIIPLSKRFDAGNDNVLYQAAANRIFLQSAWHGSPHNFDSFDSNAIGTGEGSAAHGWGLYFAQNRNISEDYRDKLRGFTVKTPDGVEYFEMQDGMLSDAQGKRPNSDSTKGAALMYFAMSDFSKEKASRMAQKWQEALLRKNPDENEEICRRYQAIQSLIAGSTVSQRLGHLYKVDIPDSECLLDEDKKFSEQTPQVKQGIRKLFDSFPEKSTFIYTNLHRDDPRLFGTVEDLNELAWEDFTSMDGAKIYMRIADKLAKNDWGCDYKAASLALNSVGIKGIAYDGYQDGRCFVVFDDKAVKILEKMQRQEHVVLGSMTERENGQRVITLFENADETTFVHEMGHLFLNDLENLATVDEESRQDLKVIMDWAEWREGAAEEYMGTPWEQEFRDREKRILAAIATGRQEEAICLKQEWAQERFARGFEEYLGSGRAPNSGLQHVFEKFKNWMSKVYQGFQRINGRVTPEIEQVMDRMLIKKGSSNASAGNMYQELKSDTESSREERLAKIQSVIQPDGSIDFASLPQDKAQRKYLLEAAMALARNDKAFSPQNIRETEKDISHKLAAQGITAKEIIKAAVLCSPACPSKEGDAQETPSVQAESMTR